MTLPADIRHTPSGQWNRRDSEAWTDAPLRAQVLSFLRVYRKARGWVRKWDVTERFTDNGIEARVQRGPSQLYDNTDAAHFKQRPGDRLLIIGITTTDKYGGRRYEVGILFPNGIDTPPSELSNLLSHAATSLDVEHRKAQGIA